MRFKGISPYDYNKLTVGELENCKSILVYILGNINFNLDKIPTLLATDFE